MTDYELLNRTLRSMIDGVPHPVSNLANASALLWEALEDINWAGFYLMEEEILVLGPFQGKTACIEIGPGKGVCGAAAAQNRTQLVPDVHAFPGHIACDSASNSEIVVPLRRRDGTVFGVLDIDSPLYDRFSEDDCAGLESFAATLSEHLSAFF